MLEVEIKDGYIVKIDNEDEEFFKSMSPFVHFHPLSRLHYVTSSVGGCFFSVAKALMNPPEGLVVIYKDGDGLNLQKENLFVCTKSYMKLNQGIRKKITPLPRRDGKAPIDITTLEAVTPKEKGAPKKKGPPIKCWDEKNIARRERNARNGLRSDHIYKNKKVAEDVRRKYLAEELVEKDELKVATFDNLADVFKDFKPDGWEPPNKLN